MVTDLTKRHYTRQHHTIINARYAMSRAEIDIVLTLLTAIHKDDKDFKDYAFTLKDIEIKTGRQWNSKQLKDVVKSLMSKPLELPKEGKGWSIINWFSNFEYGGEGLITCRFDKNLKPYLIDLKGRFILSDIRHILPMKSSYSKRIYLLLKEYQKFGIRKFSVEELMDLLKVPKSMRGFAQFKQKVLNRSKEDINQHTDLLIEIEKKKKGRKIVDVIFHIKSNMNDFKEFKKVIRKLYTNQTLDLYKHGSLACSGQGLLYFKEAPELHINTKYAQELWQELFNIRKNLLIFQKNLLDIVDQTTFAMLREDVEEKVFYPEIEKGEASLEWPKYSNITYKMLESRYPNDIDAGDILLFLPCRDITESVRLYGKDEDRIRIKYNIPTEIKLFDSFSKAMFFYAKIEKKYIDFYTRIDT